MILAYFCDIFIEYTRSGILILGKPVAGPMLRDHLPIYISGRVFAVGIVSVNTVDRTSVRYVVQAILGELQSADWRFKF